MRGRFAAVLLGVCLFLCNSQAMAHSDASAFGESDESHHDALSDHGDATLYPAVIIVDPRKMTNVALKVNARITRILAEAVGREVSRGEVLAEFDSAELSTLQRTYIETVANRAAMIAISTTGEEKLLEGRMNLAWRGLSENEIEWIERNRRPVEKVEIVSPVDGYIVSMDVAISRIVSAGSRTNLFSSSGTTLFQIAGKGALTVDASIPVSKAGSLQPGSIVSLHIVGDYPLKELTGSVDQVVPIINPNNRTQTVRIKPTGETAMHALRAGMRIHVALDAEMSGHHHD